MVQPCKRWQRGSNPPWPFGPPPSHKERHDPPRLRVQPIATASVSAIYHNRKPRSRRIQAGKQALPRDRLCLQRRVLPSGGAGEGGGGFPKYSPWGRKRRARWNTHCTRAVNKLPWQRNSLDKPTPRCTGGGGPRQRIASFVEDPCPRLVTSLVSMSSHYSCGLTYVWIDHFEVDCSLG